MSNNFVERFCHKYFQKNPKKSREDILKNLTHLYLNGRKIEEIGEVTCEQLKVLYLHNNFIHRIENLDRLVHLTHLYLQWNRIQKIENINHLKNLRKLYLSYNEIPRLEGIDQLHQLEELHLEYQNLSQENHFTFDLDSLIGISTSLRLLNISGLKLNDLNLLKTLPDLVEIIAADNEFENSEYIASSISHLLNLRSATFTGCPAQNDIYYRNKIILESKSLGLFHLKQQSTKHLNPLSAYLNGSHFNEITYAFGICIPLSELLDKKIINDVTRSFLKNFDRVKTEQKLKLASNTNVAKEIVDIDLRDDIQLIGSDAITFDVTNIISQAIVENVQCKPWTDLHE